MRRWLVLIAPLDETDAVERLELTDADAYVHADEVGVSIQTWSLLGKYTNERIVPWRRILDYRKIDDESTVTP